MPGEASVELWCLQQIPRHTKTVFLLLVGSPLLRERPGNGEFPLMVVPLVIPSFLLLLPSVCELSSLPSKTCPGKGTRNFSDTENRIIFRIIAEYLGLLSK